MVDQAARIVDVVGDRTAAVLIKAFDIRTAGDLLRHYPRRYYERGELTDLASLREGDQVTIQVKVARVNGRQIRPKLHKLDLTVTDATGKKLLVTFFNRHYLAKQLHEGKEIVLAGEVERFRSELQLKQPEIALDADAFTEEAGTLLPIYPATAKLPSWQVRKAVQTGLETIDTDEILPPEILENNDLVSLKKALQWIHRPEGWGQVTLAKKRLKFDEAFVMQVVLAQRRYFAAVEPTKPRAPRAGGLLEAFDARLPFVLTDGQQQVSAELMADLSGEIPMNRLLQGEVGSGKTVVALRAMLAVVDSGGQAVLLAPTEVLAQQHARSIGALLGPLGRLGELGSADEATKIALVTGSMSAAQRRTTLLDVGVGDAGIVIGTHALLEDRVQFFDLGLIVVDEQHRFGVEQRDVLRSRADTPPHVLVMTATPIPRTVAMTVYGDLETSTLSELPAGRQPISTTVVPTAEKPGWMDRVWERAREEVASGRQVYVVCPRIDAADDDDPGADLDDETSDGWANAASVSVVAPLLTDDKLAGLRVEVLHGRLAPDAKDDVMRRFSAGEIDVLVATTVIEVGVNVANATAMVILDADRFGISQLHQLRGRVGRGGHPGVCLLVTGSQSDTPARERLDGVAATTDGFELARLDLEQRREGNVLGDNQSGRKSSLRLLRLLRDEDVIEEARVAARALIADDPTLEHHPALRAAAESLAEGDRADYLDKT